MPTNTFTQLASTSIASTTASFTFSGIPSGYTDLRVVWNSRMQSSTDNLSFYALNGDAAANYIGHLYYGDSAGFPSGNYRTADTPGVLSWRIPTSADTAGMYNRGFLDIHNYLNTTHRKAMHGVNDTDGALNDLTWTWNNTAAITSITFNMTGNAGFLINSTFALYGILAA